MLTPEIQKYIDQSVLCWLATSSADGTPNVSPKEMFAAYQDDHIIVANISSPRTIRNLRTNNKVCISFVDILVQKGYKLTGQAQIIPQTHADYGEMMEILFASVEGEFPVQSIIKIRVEQAKPIIAPSYYLFPETTEASQIASAKKSYGLTGKSA